MRDELAPTSLLQGGLYQENLTTRLNKERQILLKRIEQINHILSLLDANPALQEVLDALAEMGIH